MRLETDALECKVDYKLKILLRNKIYVERSNK